MNLDFKFQCHNCLAIFGEEKEINYHLRRKTCTPRCTLCERQLQFGGDIWMPQISDGPYKQHLENCRNAKSVGRRCPRCLFGHYNFNLTQHVKEVPKCKIICGHCGEFFYSMKQRNNHARTCTGQHISCRHCLKIFAPPNMVDNYRQHFVLVTLKGHKFEIGHVILGIHFNLCTVLVQVNVSPQV